MTPNPALGILLHALGGLGAASFYVPLKGVRKWAWESSWMLANIFFLVVCPGLVASITVPQIGAVLSSVSGTAILTALGLGLCWGIGNLCFGLTLRYLGMSLAFALALGFCTIFGTLGPPIIKGIAPSTFPSLANQKPIGALLTQSSGQATLGGLGVCLFGIALCGWAGMRKESEVSDAEKKESVREYNFAKGICTAFICGMMSSCLNLAITDTEPIAVRVAALGTDPLWSNSVTMAIFLSGGAASNLLWCLMLNYRNKSGGDYFNHASAPLAANYFLCSLAGVIMYSEFFFYAIAAPQMGKFSFTNLPIHLALVIVLGNIWAIVFREWRGTSKGTRVLIGSGIVVLVLSTLFMGWGSYLEEQQNAQTKSTSSALPPVP